MAILTSSKGFTYDTESGVRTNPDKTTTQIKSIKTSDMEGTETPNLPEARNNDYSSLMSSIDSTLSSAKKDSEIEDFYRNQKLENQKIFGLMSDVGQEEGLIKKYGMEEGAFEAKEQYNDYVSQIESEQKALRDQTEKIRKNLTGALDIGVQSQISDLERKSLSKQADLAILQNAASKRYSTAMEIARNKVEMELAPKKAELEAYKFIIDNNKPFQTAMFNSILKQKENEIAREEKNKLDGEQLILNAIQGGAPSSIINQARTSLSNGGRKSDIMSILGDYSLSESDRLDIKIKNASLANIYSQIEERKNTNLKPAEQEKQKDILNQEKTKIDTFSNVALLANKLLTSPKLKRAVGLSTYTVAPGSEAYDFKQTANQLINTLAAANLDKMKGAMSDKDIQFLRNIESNLALNMSEKGFKNELTRIISTVTGKLKEDFGVDFKMNMSDLSNDELINLQTQNEDNATFFNNL